MKILFVGQTWNGSSARSLRDALATIDDIEIDDIGEDHYRLRAKSLLARAANRMLVSFLRRDLKEEILMRCQSFAPDVVVIYKGAMVSLSALRRVRSLGIPLVNIFPDCSPHAFGEPLKEAMGLYDLVISTKPFHPPHWRSTYGYQNCCVCVPHGYDPKVHLWKTPPAEQDIDVVLAASWRPQYEELMLGVAEGLSGAEVSVALAGPGWRERRAKFPSHWCFPGPLYGRAYGEFVRRGKIAIAPVHSEVQISGQAQPGDEDTTRTYELAAAGVFFLHRRTPYALTVYREGVEADFWDDASELVSKIRAYLPLQEMRRQMALAAHQRAVPAYSIHARAAEVVRHLERCAGLSIGSRADA